MKKLSYKIEIPEPCHESWKAMQPDATGRFCKSCSKSVIDFTSKTDTEIRDLLIEYKDQKVCGHFKKSQVNRPLNVQINLRTLPQNVSSTNLFAIALVLVFGTFLFSCINPEGKKIDAIEVTNQNEYEYTTTGMMVAPRGVVTEDTLPEKDVITKEIISEMYVDGGVGLVETQEVADSLIITKKTPSPLDSLEIFSTEDTMLGGIGMVIYPEEPEDTLQSQVAEKTNQLLNKKEPQLSIYPNPSQGKSTVSYTVVKKSTISLHIFDMNGSLVKTLVAPHEQYEGTYNLPLNLSDLPNGIYIVNLVNDGKRFTEKIVLEK